MRFHGKFVTLILAGAVTGAIGLTWQSSNASGSQTAPTTAGEGSGKGVSAYVTPSRYLQRTLVTSLAARQTTPMLAERRTTPLLNSFAAPLSAGTSPVAVLADDGTTLVHASWKLYPTIDAAREILPGQVEGRPSIRRLNLQTGENSLVVDGANSFALGGDQLAYVLGTSPDYVNSKRYTGSIHIRSLSDPATDRILTGEANWRIAAWTGDTLLAYQEGEGESLELFAIAPDGSVRSLVAGASVIAVSPDGTQVAVTSVTDGPPVSILAVATGKVQATLGRATTLAGDVSTGLVGQGDWKGTQLVAALRDRPGYAQFTVAPGAVELASVMNLNLSKFPWGISAPTFANDGAVTASAFTPGGKWGGSRGGHAITCFTTCSSTSVSDELGATPQRVYNPSRPLL